LLLLLISEPKKDEGMAFLIFSLIRKIYILLFLPQKNTWGFFFIGYSGNREN